MPGGDEGGGGVVQRRRWHDVARGGGRWGTVPRSEARPRSRGVEGALRDKLHRQGDVQ